MDIRAFVASVIFAVIIGLIAFMLLSVDGAADVAVSFQVSWGDGGDVPAQATAAPPLPLPTATSAPPEPLPPPPPLPVINLDDLVLPTIPPSILDPYGSGQTSQPAAAPYDRYGSHLTYCHAPGVAHAPDAAWTAEARAITAAAFAAWEGTGLTFGEVAYSPHPADCFLLVRAGADPQEKSLGIASAVGPLWGMQNWIWSNTAQMPHNLDVAIHEIGHVLGLTHTAVGLMQPTVQFGLRPGQTEFAAVRRFWFGEE